MVNASVVVIGRSTIVNASIVSMVSMVRRNGRVAFLLVRVHIQEPLPFVAMIMLIMLIMLLCLCTHGVTLRFPEYNVLE
jgi:hypothetical protein